MNAQEQDRLFALRQLNLLDTSPSESFDRITRMASQLFGLPIAAVSLTDENRQWFKSRVGVDHWEIPRETAPCGEVCDASEVLVIPDLLPRTVTEIATWQSQVSVFMRVHRWSREKVTLWARCAY